MAGHEGERPEGESEFHPLFADGSQPEGFQKFHPQFADGSKPEGYNDPSAEAIPSDEAETGQGPHFADGSKPEGYNEIPK